MKILDLDMDYFMEHIACIPFSVSDRLDEDNYGDTVWSEARVRNFLENNLGYLRKKKFRKEL